MNIIEEVKKLSFPVGEYVVISGGTLAALGIRSTSDIDIAVTSNLYNTLRASGEWRERKQYNQVFLELGLVTIIPRLDWEAYPTTTEEAIGAAIVIDDIPFMNLLEVRRFKMALNREKDRADIALIDAYLKEHSERSSS